jgi:hypothetical protein
VGLPDYYLITGVFHPLLFQIISAAQAQFPFVADADGVPATPAGGADPTRSGPADFQVLHTAEGTPERCRCLAGQVTTTFHRLYVGNGRRGQVVEAGSGVGV